MTVTGRIYHRLFDIARPHHSLHWFLFDEHDREQEAHKWDVPLSWVEAVRSDLNDVNPYLAHVRNFTDTCNQNQNMPDATLELLDDTSSADFAAVIHASNSTRVQPRSILIWNKTDNDPTFVPIFNRHYEPLQYPLLFPHGTPGWGLPSNPTDTNQRTNKLPMSQRLWYKGHLLTDDRYLSFGRLTCEYLCDMYSRIEEERLGFIRRGRLRHAMHTDSSSDPSSIDINLPATFLRSHRWASNQTADSLALARVYGVPDLFLTMTFNPDWPEIKSRLKPGQTAHDIPFIVVRVFKERLRRLQEILKTKLGTCIFMITVIEFQKRGYPHAHIVLKVSCSICLACF